MTMNMSRTTLQNSRRAVPSPAGRALGQPLPVSPTVQGWVHLGQQLSGQYPYRHGVDKGNVHARGDAVNVLPTTSPRHGLGIPAEKSQLRNEGAALL